MKTMSKTDGPNLKPLDEIMNLHDVEEVAARSLDRRAWSYYKSAAQQELTAQRNESDWDLIRFRPRVLRDVSSSLMNSRVRICGFESSFPVFIAPAALAKLAHVDGEKALVRAAGKLGIIYMVSSNASYSLEEISECKAPGQVLFYQLYVNRDRKKTEELLKRVERSGFSAIVLTIDAPVAGIRTRDERFRAGVGGKKSVTTSLAGYIDDSLDWQDLTWIKTQTKLPIILKGIQTTEDFLKAYNLGYKKIYLSNHGGRQLDGSQTALEILIEIRQNILIDESDPDLEFYLDGGIRGGNQVVKARALGVRAVGIARPVMYSLLWGQEGVEKVLRLVKEEMEVAMKLLGETDVHQLGPHHVNASQLERWSYKVPKIHRTGLQPIKHLDSKL